MSVLSCGDAFTQLQLKHTPTLFTSHKQLGRGARNGCLSPGNIPQWLQTLRYSCCENDKYFSSSTPRYLLFLLQQVFTVIKKGYQNAQLGAKQGLDCIKKLLTGEN